MVGVQRCDPKAVNSFEDPNVIRAFEFGDVQAEAGVAIASLPPTSVVAMCCACSLGLVGISRNPRLLPCNKISSDTQSPGAQQ